MIKIMLISNMDNFIDKINSCQGDVMLHLSDGSECSIKTDNTVRQMLKMYHSDGEELNISLTDKRDYGVIMNYLMSAAA